MVNINDVFGCPLHALLAPPPPDPRPDEAVQEVFPAGKFSDQGVSAGQDLDGPGNVLLLAPSREVDTVLNKHLERNTAFGRH